MTVEHRPWWDDHLLRVSASTNDGLKQLTHQGENSNANAEYNESGLERLEGESNDERDNL